MKSFAGKVALVTGGGAGIGAELATLLVGEGARVAICDIDAGTMDATVARAAKLHPGSTAMSTHVCDVSNFPAVLALREEVLAAHATDCVHVVVNNAGIAGGNSFVAGDQGAWDRTFAVCWGGVYNVTRAFLQPLLASEAALLLNVSSINGLWAALGPGIPHSAYSTAKFAVRGFSESLLEDLRVHAPHVQVAVAIPGHVGTGIIENSHHALRDPDGSEEQGDETQVVRSVSDAYRQRAPLTPSEAALQIIAGVREGQWRILVGQDAHAIDDAVRADPTGAYGPAGLTVPTFGFTGRVSAE